MAEIRGGAGTVFPEGKVQPPKSQKLADESWVRCLACRSGHRGWLPEGLRTSLGD
jgi:hypothetical protein